jgi:arabinofuranosyltransferase
MNTGVAWSESTTQGLLYYLNSFGWDPITLTIIFSSLILTFLSKRKEEILIALGIVLYLGYIVYIGGDFMSGRFFSTPLLLGVILLVRRAEQSSALEKYTWIGLVLLIGLIIAPLKSFANPLESDLVTFDNTTGIADERNGYYRFSNLLLFSRNEDLTLHPFAEYGLYLKEENPKVTVLSGIGMAGYFAGPKVHIVDELGLGDPLLSRLRPIDLSTWNIAHFRRNIPNGYLETLESGANNIADPSLAEYYEKIRLITRGDIWSLERWSTIWKMNTGQYDDLIEEYLKSQEP